MEAGARLRCTASCAVMTESQLMSAVIALARRRGWRCAHFRDPLGSTPAMVEMTHATETLRAAALPVFAMPAAACVIRTVFLQLP